MMSEQIKCGISIPWDVIQPQQGMTRAAVGTNLASITLSERSPSQKAIFYDRSFDNSIASPVAALPIWKLHGAEVRQRGDVVWGQILALDWG